MLEKHVIQRVRDGIATLFFAPYEEGGARYFGAFCRTDDGEEYDVMLNLNHMTPADIGDPLRFKSLTALFDWFKKNLPDAESFSVTIESIGTSAPSEFTLSKLEPAAADTANDQARLLAIKNALRAKGSSFAAVARDLDLTPAAVRNVCLRKSTSQRVEDEVSRILGIEREKLFLTFNGYQELASE